MSLFDSTLGRLVREALGEPAAASILEVVKVHPALLQDVGGRVPRAIAAMALNVVLMDDLLRRVPTGAAYVEDRRAAGERITFDHGALRTILFGAGPTGGLPPGRKAFSRILEPFGYQQTEVYPLDRLRMTGYSFTHRDLPEAIPQFFVSELHVERFSPDFHAAAERVFGASVDPLTPSVKGVLASLHSTGAVSFEVLAESLPTIAVAFGRQHPDPLVVDYDVLREESQEAAWIATEGNAFNHVTDRVPDVQALAVEQRAMGRPMKDLVEVSASGRVLQTAFKADAVNRRFRTPAGLEGRVVPGSFYEFITRGRHADGRLDLAFDSSNAQGIFKMTAAE